MSHCGRIGCHKGPAVAQRKTARCHRCNPRRRVHPAKMRGLRGYPLRNSAGMLRPEADTAFHQASQWHEVIYLRSALSGCDYDDHCGFDVVPLYIVIFLRLLQSQICRRRVSGSGLTMRYMRNSRERDMDGRENGECKVRLSPSTGVFLPAAD